MSQDEMTVLEKVRRALGRSRGSVVTPVPPAVDERLARMVGTDARLAELFAKRAEDLKMKAAFVSAGELVGQLVEFLREQKCGKIVVAEAPVLERLGVRAALLAAGFEVRGWEEIQLDELYDWGDCSVTDVAYAVAETASLVIKPTAGQGRGLSLVPMVHVAVIEPEKLVPDLLDLMAVVNAEGVARNIILISGPSKTADIEMNVVTGVHGPNVVKAFILR